MKFKYSFVTNSSSTSFVVLGISKFIKDIPNYENIIKKICKKVKVRYKKPNDTYNGEYCEVDCLNDGHLDVYTCQSNTRLIASFGSENTQLMVGIPFHKIQDNEIFGMVKEYVVEECKRVFELDINVEDIDIIEESWCT